MPANYLAFDLGASSGRAMLGTFDGQRLRLEELHRFENGPARLGGHLCWNAVRLYEELKAGLGRCTQRGVRLDAFGIDTWGVDFGLLSAGGELLTLPRHYRDARPEVMARVLERLGRGRVYERTGIQFLPFNTLYQLAGIAERNPGLLACARRLLFMPDLLAHWLTGCDASERSIASTSQMLDPRAGAWAADLLAELTLPAGILPPIAASGTPAEPLRADVADEVGQAGVRLVHTAEHDTAAAVAAVPAAGEDWAYISSGTWSLVGVELPGALISAESLAAEFTNEAGVAGTVRFLRNVAGLWLVQECQRTWAQAGQRYTHAELTELAEAAGPAEAWVDPDDPQFAEPGDMPARIRAACEAAGHRAPEGPGAVVRCALESLARKSAVVLERLERLLGRRMRVVHVVGGGSRNDLLNQLTADATGRVVRAGPAEATAAGNVLVQALGEGRVGSLAELRAVVAGSFEVREFAPRSGSGGVARGA